MEARKLLRKIRDGILWQKFFFNRGYSIGDDIIKLFTLTTIVGLFIDLINRNFGTQLDVGKAMMAIPLIVIFYWMIGRLDFKKIHIIQKENEIQMQANPALYDKLTNINTTINEMKNGNKEKAEDK